MRLNRILTLLFLANLSLYSIVVTIQNPKVAEYLQKG